MSNERISKHDYYLNIANEVASRGTCLRRNFGSVIVKNDRIVSTGYTGAPRGRKNCCDLKYCVRTEQNIPRGERYELCVSGNTMIRIPNGISKTIRDLSLSVKDNMMVYSVYDNRIVEVAASQPVMSGTKEVVHITFGDGTHLRCTPDHKIMLVDKTYKNAGDLTTYDNIMGYKEETITSGEQSKQILRLSSKRIVKIENVPHTIDVYDITVAATENFAIDLGNGSGVFVHNCRSVHSEMNAIINASREDTMDATLYLVGKEKETDEYVDNPNCCAMCKRAVINAGIKNVVVRDKDLSIKIIDVNDWVTNDETLELKRGY